MGKGQTGELHCEVTGMIQKIKSRASLFLLLALLVGITGCHPAAMVVPSYLKNVGVGTFENRTSYFGLETELTQATVQAFQLDGRLPLEDPDHCDLIVKVIIRQYIEQPIFFDPKTNYVLQYQLSIVYDLAAVDKIENKTFLEDTNKTHSVYYYTPQYTGAITQTKDQAIAQLMSDTARAIVVRVLEGY